MLYIPCVHVSSVSFQAVLIIWARLEVRRRFHVLISWYRSRDDMPFDSFCGPLAINGGALLCCRQYKRDRGVRNGRWQAIESNRESPVAPDIRTMAALKSNGKLETSLGSAKLTLLLNNRPAGAAEAWLTSGSTLCGGGPNADGRISVCWCTVFAGGQYCPLMGIPEDSAGRLRLLKTTTAAMFGCVSILKRAPVRSLRIGRLINRSFGSHSSVSIRWMESDQAVPGGNQSRWKSSVVGEVLR